LRVRHVVTSFLIDPQTGAVLLGRRSGRVSTYPGCWAAISGSLETTAPLQQALCEIKEETGLSPAQVQLAAEGWPVRFTDWQLGTVWVVHPFLFRCTAPSEARHDWEHVQFEWVSPDTIRSRQSVPKLWEAYLSASAAAQSGGRYGSDQVFDLVCEDREHGAEELGIWTLMGLKAALREAAQRCGSAREILSAVRKRCRTAATLRPSMAPLLSGALAAYGICEDALSDDAVDAQRAVARAVESLDALISGRENAPLQAARHAAGLIPRGARLVTLSYSFTVLAALREAAERVSALTVAESRPACEGRRTAQVAASFGIATELMTDAAAASALCSADMAIFGADALLPDGSIVNKTGTLSLCCAARFFGRKTMAVATESKLMPSGLPMRMEEMRGEELGEAIAGVRVSNPYFERVPGDLVDAVIAGSGPLSAGRIEAASGKLRLLYDELLGRRTR